MEEMKYTCATCGAKANNVKLIVESWMLIDGKYYCSLDGLDRLQEKIKENNEKDGEAGIHKGRKSKGK